MATRAGISGLDGKGTYLPWYLVPRYSRLRGWVGMYLSGTIQSGTLDDMQLGRECMTHRYVP